LKNFKIVNSDIEGPADREVTLQDKDTDEQTMVNTTFKEGLISLNL
jgi:hypothetical protein